MRKFFASISDYLLNMDARTVRAIMVTALLLGSVAVVLVLGRLVLGDEVRLAVKTWLGGAERAHWGLPAAILAFTIAAFLAAPQFVLIAACAVAFGPERGFWYAWIATMVSGAATFWLGRVVNIRQYSKHGTFDRITGFMGKNAFLASAMIRNVPTAPFIVVNMAMGAANMGFFPFIAGLTLGVLPKTAMVAFGGDSLMDALEGKAGSAVLGALAAVACWFVVVAITRTALRGENKENSPNDAKNLRDTTNSASSAE